MDYTDNAVTSTAQNSFKMAIRTAGQPSESTACIHAIFFQELIWRHGSGVQAPNPQVSDAGREHRNVVLNCFRLILPFIRCFKLSSPSFA